MRRCVGKHINNALSEELRFIPTVANFAIVQKEGSRFVERTIEHYNLDMIISIGYRVKSEKGILFRQWANKIIKEYFFKGYSINGRLSAIERRLDDHDKKIDFFVRTSLPPVEGIFYDGQIFDAYVFASDLIKSACQRIVLFDNYVDESVLVLLSKRSSDVSAEIRTGRLPQQLQLDLQKHNSQYEPITLVQTHSLPDTILAV